VRCPTCKRDVEEGAPQYPFCNPRCRLIDLGQWASGAYVISTPLEPEAAPAPTGALIGGENAD